MGFLDRWRMTGLCRVRKSHKFRGVHLVPGPKLVLVWDFSTSLLLRYQLPHTGCSASIRPFGVLAACSSWRIWRLDAQLPESAQERSSRFGSSSRLPRSSTSALAVRKSPRLREPGRLPLPRKYALWDFLTESPGNPPRTAALSKVKNPAALAEPLRITPRVSLPRYTAADYTANPQMGQKSDRLPTKPATSAGPTADFTAAERAYVRRELDEVFATLPAAADGFRLKTRRTGPNSGEPKIPPAGQSLLDRGLMRLKREPSPRLIFTDAGWAALKHMMADPVQADPEKFAHIRRELNIGSGGC